MSLQTRLQALITAIGADIKSLSTRATALEDYFGGWSPQDFGYISQSVPNHVLSANYPPVAGTVFGARVKNPTALGVGDTVNIDYQVGIAGSGATALANVFAQLYRADTRAAISGSSANLATAWGTAGQKTLAFTLTAAIPADVDILVGFVVGTQSTVQAQLARGSGVVSANGRLTGNNAIYFTANTGQSSMPASLSSLAAIGAAIYVGRY